MRTLIVAPVEIGSGETISAIHAAEKLAQLGHEVRFLCSRFARLLLSDQFSNSALELSADQGHNERLWSSALAEFRPDVIVLADFPLLFFSSGVAPIIPVDELVPALQAVDALLFSFDHMYFAQKSGGMFFGPPHISFHYEEWQAPPECVKLLLPCPMLPAESPTPRRGIPFRNLNVPLRLPKARRHDIRSRLLREKDSFLIFHAVPSWATRLASSQGLPLYSYFSDILEYHLGDLAERTTLVSVNDGRLLRPSISGRLHVVNRSPMQKEEFEEILLSADLMVTENRVSLSMGKAICGLIPSVVLRNSYRYRELVPRLSQGLWTIVSAMERVRPGAIYPFDIFPTGGRDELQRLGLYRNNSITNCFADLEIFSETDTADSLHQLLADEEARQSMRDHQLNYVRSVAGLPDAADVVCEQAAHVGVKS